MLGFPTLKTDLYLLQFSILSKSETFLSNFSIIKNGRDILIHKSLEIRKVACKWKIFKFLYLLQAKSKKNYALKFGGAGDLV